MKRYHRYQIDYQGKAIWLSGICIALSVFLQAVYDLFLQGIGTVGVLAQIFNLWLPLILSMGYLVLLRIIKWNAPGTLALIGAAFCLLLMLQLFTCGAVLRIILGILGYLVGGALLIFCAGGFLPGRLVASLVFLVILVLRLLLFRSATGLDWIAEISDLSVIAGLMFLPISFHDPMNQK